MDHRENKQNFQKLRFLSLKKKKKKKIVSIGTLRTLVRIFVRRILWKSLSPLAFVTPSPRRSWIIQLPAIPREKRIPAFLETLLPPTMGIPQRALREMRRVSHLNAGHLELSGFVPSFFRRRFVFCHFMLWETSFLSWYIRENLYFRKCGETLFCKDCT